MSCPTKPSEKKAIDDFAAKHPKKNVALAIFTPPPKVDSEDFLKQLDSTEPKNPPGQDGDLYFSVGQWKRMTINANEIPAPAPRPPKLEP